MRALSVRPRRSSHFSADLFAAKSQEANFRGLRSGACAHQGLEFWSLDLFFVHAALPYLHQIGWDLSDRFLIGG